MYVCNNSCTYYGTAQLKFDTRTYVIFEAREFPACQP